jgi:hypothetical protein
LSQKGSSLLKKPCRRPSGNMSEELFFLHARYIEHLLIAKDVPAHGPNFSPPGQC